MSMDLEQIELEMKELDQCFTAGYQQANAAQRERWDEIIHSGYVVKKLRRWYRAMRSIFNKDWAKNRAMNETGRGIANDFRRPYDEEVHQRLDHVCMFYLLAEAKDRESMREFARSQARLLYGLERHPQWCAHQLDTTKNPQFLKTGLSAVSLYDLSTLSNTEINLEFLHHSAVKAGIDPKQDFKDVADLSTPVGRHPGYLSTMAVIARFGPTSFLEKRVLPYLPE
jgi:hypothetical protein